MGAYSWPLKTRRCYNSLLITFNHQFFNVGKQCRMTFYLHTGDFFYDRRYFTKPLSEIVLIDKETFPLQCHFSLCQQVYEKSALPQARLDYNA